MAPYYLIVNCGYTSRLMKHVKKIEVKLFYIWYLNFDTESGEFNSFDSSPY
jgi:hypothetical protein